ncbi:MAG: N-6 DNA methylase [Alphaproteobacteria bacterium]|nr:N-6 DNA methylase [Alphaproteobacteria bacterium]
MYDVAGYLVDIDREFKTGVAKEHSYRPALKKLFESINTSKPITAINEPQRGTFGAPDFMIKSGDAVIGFAEAKDIGVNRLDNLFDRELEQKERYLDGLPNLIYTDYLEFRFYREGNETARVRIADFDGKTITPLPDKFQTLVDLIKDFYTVKTATIKSPLKLAELMAGKARLIADVIKGALKEQTENKSLYEQLESFRKILIRTMTEQEFADIYAQTVAYGMFVARLHDKTMHDFTRQEAATLIPKTVPFLRKMFDYIAGNDIDERIVWSVDSLASIFSYTDVADLFKDYGRKTKTTDPIIHFYETFLSKYNPSERVRRGAFYTPQPVVDYIVRAVDEILKTDFELSDGLADKSKITKDIQMQGASKPVKKEFHRVQLLDPATGTGTFLATAVNYIHNKFKSNAGVWPHYVENDLLPRMHGFEIMMSSYAMAHLKLDLVLRETGYIQDDARINDKIFRQDNLFDGDLARIARNSTILNTNNRVGIYLTNSLEEADPDTQTLWAAQWLSDEAKEANNIKQNVPVMCVLGNPPYNASSANTNDYIMNLMDAYKKEPGGKVKLKERNPKWINDDYVKFIRLAEHFIEKNKNGIVAFITNNGFLDNPTFRGMRWHLLNTFDKCYIINLHGRSKPKENAPADCKKDENVFDIQVGTSINIFIKNKDSAHKKCELYYRDLWGNREYKYEFLQNNNLLQSGFSCLTPTEPNYFFIPKDTSMQKTYEKGFLLPELCPLNSVGIVTARDDLAIQKTAQDVKNVINDFANLDPETARQKYHLGKDARDWTVIGAQNDLKQTGIDEKLIVPYAYRVFDTRYTYYTGNSKGFQCMARARARAMNHILNKDNIVLIAKRGFINDTAPGFITNIISDFRLWSCSGMQGGDYIFPLYIYINGDKIPNLNQQIVREIESKVGQTTPESIFDYIYGVLHSPSYREKYREFLKIDFPRIPYPENKDKFEHYRKYGEQLRKLHLMQDMPQSNVTFPIGGDCIVDKPVYDNGRVYINKTQYFDNVPQTAWDFYIGGYQPAQKYLKDRKGRTLTPDEVEHYEQIIAVLIETDRIIKEI